MQIPHLIDTCMGILVQADYAGFPRKRRHDGNQRVLATLQIFLSSSTAPTPASSLSITFEHRNDEAHDIVRGYPQCIELGRAESRLGNTVDAESSALGGQHPKRPGQLEQARKLAACSLERPEIKFCTALDGS